MTDALLPYVEVDTGANPQACVVWLHGLGDSGHGFAPIVPELKVQPTLPIKFLFPHAPERPVTVNGGMRMRAWYDIKSFDLDNRADETGVIESATAVEQLLNYQIEKGIPANKIVLAGFSQGGVIALHLGTRIEKELAGIMALSTYMCVPQKLSSEASDTNKKTPILMAHGTHDNVVPISLGKMACDALIANGFAVTWSDYPMEHNICMEEIEAIRQWLQQVLG